jgi:NifB/MoaA-like Fe-S oxidoreductase
LNDGDALDDTMLGILDRFPRLATVGVVPLGVSAHTREPDLRPHTRAEAVTVLETVERWQARFFDAVDRRLAYAADEYYLLAGRPFPAVDEYDGLPQHENGIGMARAFADDVRRAIAGEEVDGIGTRSGFFAWVEGAPADGYRALRAPPSSRAPSSSRAPDALQVVDGARRTVILTGEYGASVLEPLLPELEEAARAPVDVLPVANSFFGGNIAVTGLLTGRDVADALSAATPDARYLLPDVVLSGGRFLDGLTLTDLPLPVEVVPTDGASLVGALR